MTAQKALFAGSTVHLKVQSRYRGQHHNLNSLSVVKLFTASRLGLSVLVTFFML